ncbi:MAG: Bax inhibitor-1 family protein [Verrucomicrobia bacterium]|nr:Bax inhibitor-1 family protein [Verrucomicrobiota bacterium]
MESNPFIVADAPAADRAAFFRRTYGLVAIGFAAFAALLAIFFVGFDQRSGIAFAVFAGLGSMIKSLGGWSILLVMLAFWGATTLAQSLAFNRSSRGTQYAGLGLYVILEALIFIPLIGYVILSTKGNASSVLVPAGIVTGGMIAGLTALVFMTNLDFSFLKVAIILGSFAALAIVLVAAIAGLSLGAWFSIAMIVLMATVILYQTNEIKNTLETDQHVAAAFILFSSFVTLLFYVIRFFAGGRRD